LLPGGRKNSAPAATRRLLLFEKCFLKHFGKLLSVQTRLKPEVFFEAM